MTTPPARVYLDHNATSPLRPEALAAMRTALESRSGNASSLHAEGRAARAMLEKARHRVAGMIGASSDEVVFTSSGSEAIASAIQGVCDRAPSERRRVVLGALEHSSVLESAKLAARRGCVLVQVPCGREGRVDVERFVTQLGSDVAMAALQWANNETGVIQPVEEIGHACRQKGIPFLVDAVQAAGKLVMSTTRDFADLLAISGHKLGAPQGTGALIVRQGLVLAPLIGGGAQEKRRRGGTEAVAALHAFGVTAEVVVGEVRDEARRLLRLRAKIETCIRELYPEANFHGQGAARLPNTVNFALPEVPGETLAIALDLVGFAVSTGSACVSGAVEPSHVLIGMGFDEETARRAVRVSLGWSTTEDEVDRLLKVLPGVVEQARAGVVDSP